MSLIYRKKLVICFSVNLVLLLAPRTNGHEPFFMGLGYLPGGSEQSWANDVSADGSVVVGASRSVASGDLIEAFIWTLETGMVGLGDLDGGEIFSIAQAVSGDGSMVVGRDGTEIPFRWTSELGMVPLLDGEGMSVTGRANGVSADGSVIVGSARLTGPTEAFRWTAETGMVGLGWLPSDPLDSFALDVSSDGLVACGISFDGTELGVAPFYWTQSEGMFGLGDIPGGEFYAIAWGISADGNTIVGQTRLTDDTPFTEEAFLWSQESGVVFLDPSHGQDWYSVAQDVSSDGSIVVGNTQLGGMIWDADHGIRLIEDVLTQDYGFDLSEWTNIRILAISDDASTLVGDGLRLDESREAWVAHIHLQAVNQVPAASTWALMVMVLLLMIAATLVIHGRFSYHQPQTF